MGIAPAAGGAIMGDEAVGTGMAEPPERASIRRSGAARG